MSTEQAVLTTTRLAETGSRRTAQGALARAFSWLDRAMLGGATPRGYRREGFPEIELHQVISGHKDRFDA